MASRVASKSLRPSRRAVRAVEGTHRAPGAERTLIGMATSWPARIAYVVVGAAGLAALAVVLVGPDRLRREVIRPIGGAIKPPAEKLWAESRPLRAQLARIMHNATPSGRARLIRDFQSWIGHFHAT